MTLVDRITELLGRLIRASQIGAGVFVLAPPVVLADTGVCRPPDDFSRLSLGYYRQNDSTLPGNAGRLGREDQDIDLQYRLNDTWLIGLKHRYVILDLDPVGLQTNGYLHTLSFPIHRQKVAHGNGFRFSIAPALSASSNIMKDPGAFSADTVQLLAAVMWTRELSARTDLGFGFCGDHRFGDYTVYPSFSLDWRPRPEWTIGLGVPVSRLIYEASARVDLSLQLSPQGNEWHVKSRDRERQSRLAFKAILVELGLRWDASESVGLRVGVARLFRSRYDAALADDTQARLSHDPTTRTGVALDWRF